MKLPGSTASPSVPKVRIVLAEKNWNAISSVEDVWSPDTTIQHSNPPGQVPCLILDDSSSVYDSRVIIRT